MNKTEICKFEEHDNIPWYEFCSGSVTKGFTKVEMSEISLDGAFYDFLVDQGAIEKEDIFKGAL